jgi:diacylglycerol kinase (ATP)
LAQVTRLIVYNPRAGAAIRRYRLRAALEVLRGLPEGHALVATEASDMVGPVRRALAECPSVRQIVACGGDGTVAACAAAVDGRDVPIGIVPTGTTNVLAYELGIPSTPVRAARLLGGATRRLPFRTWRANGGLMLLQLGIGFDGLLLWRTPRRVKHALGFIGVVASALRVGLMFDYPEMRIVSTLEDGSERTDVVTSAMLANAKRWAGPQLLIPSADHTDDLLDVLLLRYRTFPELFRFWTLVLFPGAPHLRLPFVEHVRVRRARIESVRRAVEAHVDGEPILRTPIVVEPHGIAHLLAPVIPSNARNLQFSSWSTTD